MHGLDVNPLTDIAICCGQSEAFAAAVFAGKLFSSCLFILLIKVTFLWFELVCDAVYCDVWTVIDQGEEVIIFEPSYETYEACVWMARGIPVSFLLFITEGLESLLSIKFILPTVNTKNFQF